MVLQAVPLSGYCTCLPHSGHHLVSLTARLGSTTALAGHLKLPLVNTDIVHRFEDDHASCDCPQVVLPVLTQTPVRSAKLKRTVSIILLKIIWTAIVERCETCLKTGQLSEP